MTPDIGLHVDFHLLVLCIGVLQGLVLSVCLMTFGRKTNHANWLLGLTILSYSLMLVDDILFESRLLLSVPQLSDVFSAFIFAPAPLMYLYVRSLTRREQALRWRDALHGIPFVLLVLLNLLTYLGDSAERLAGVQALYGSDRFYFNPTVVVPLAQVLAYIMAIYFLLRKHGRNIRAQFSSLEKINLRWIPYLFFGFLFIWSGWLLSYLLRWTLGLQVLDLAYTAVVYAFGYFGWRQSEVKSVDLVSQPPTSNEGAGEAEETAPRYAKSGMTAEMKLELLTKLKRLMETQKPFLDPTLSLVGLADAVGSSPHHVSRVINEDLGLSFYEYINSLRVEEAKRIMSGNEFQEAKVIAIAFESGFNSKSAFNSAFRKFAGMTPSDFRKGLPARSLP